MVNPALLKYFHVFIIIYTLTFVECQNPERIGNSTFTYTGAKYDTVTYSCKMGYVHTGGDLERTCGRNRRWSGVPPSCTSMHFNFTFYKIHVVIRNVVRYQNGVIGHFSCD
jgi:hypothetical protein